MAILYGTTGDGTTLPVLVDQFGNLLAKGIDGPEGPQGPPGIGQLPPDPYEGAILGWEDGELAWIGGSVPLPAGTYGPYTYVPGDERLDIPQDASDLINGQQIYMSDFYGNEVSDQISTSAIATVSASLKRSVRSNLITLTFPNNNNFDKFEKGDPAQPGTPNIVTFTSLTTGTPYGSSWVIANAFDGNRETSASPAQGTSMKLQILGTGVPCTNSFSYFQRLSNPAGCTIVVNETQVFTLPSGKAGQTIQIPIPNSGYLTSLEWNRVSASASVDMGQILCDGVELKDSTGVNVPVVITAIEAETNPPTITVNGGSWYGAEDGSGDPAGKTNISKTVSGAGSVFLGTNGAILLRENNKKWVNDFYVTAPEQRIAARKVASNARRRKTK